MHVWLFFNANITNVEQIIEMHPLWKQLREKETKLTIASKILQRSSASFV